MIDPLSAPLLADTSLFAPSQFHSASERDTPEAIAKAASEFESLLIGEILKSAREADGSDWLGTDENDAGASLMELSEQQLAQALASAGGLGLAKIMTVGLTKAAGPKSRHISGAGTR